MTKNIIVITIVVTIATVAVWYCLFFQKGISKNNIPTTLRVPVEVAINPSLIKNFSNSLPVEIRSSFGNSVALFTGIRIQARNPGSSLYINQKLFGPIEGVGVIDGHFSPNNIFFATHVVSICGAGCWSSMIYVADVANTKLSLIIVPRSKSDYKIDMQQYSEIKPYIESYVLNNDILQLSFFFLGVNKDNGENYRVSPKEVWNYDLLTQQYVLIKSLPE